jgi:predicted RNA methylase
MRTTYLAVLLGVFSLLAGEASAQELLYGQQHAKHYTNSLAPYVVSPQEIVDRMLELADLKPGEKLYDLGSGDGRILVTAVVRFKAKAVGVDLATDTNEILRPNLEKYLKRGSRVVSHDYSVPGWKPTLVDKDPNIHGHLIYLYEMPPKKK